MPSKYPLALFALLSLTLAQTARAYDLASCGEKLVFDCDKHKVFINGEPAYDMFCGASTPSATGRLGTRYKCPIVPPGHRYYAMSGAEAIRFFPPIGGDGQKILHGWPPKAPANLKKGFAHFLKGDHGWGCVTVDRDALFMMQKKCAGAPFQVIHRSRPSGR